MRRHQIGDDRQRRRRQHGVGGDRRALGHDAADAAVDDRQPVDARAAVDRPAVRDDELRHLVGQRDEAAAIVGQLLFPPLPRLPPRSFSLFQNHTAEICSANAPNLPRNSGSHTMR